MTTATGSPVRIGALEGKPPPLRAEPLTRCLAAALDASEAADLLGLDSRPLRAARDTGARRVGFPGDAYVLALVGGTGVGKSSLLNALAGGVVSRASPLRPTTAEPIAWIPRTEREALEPLLDWLDVREFREHDTAGLGSVAILDLPDMDSVAGDHRSRVEALLPLVDAVAWVTDNEKYADAVLHDDFLRSWLPRLGRQAVLVNKSDRVSDADARRIQRDLEADLASGVIRGSEVAVLRSSAASPDGTSAFRGWLAAGADAKRVVRGRIAASLAAAARDLAWAAGDGSDDRASRCSMTRRARLRCTPRPMPFCVSSICPRWSAGGRSHPGHGSHSRRRAPGSPDLPRLSDVRAAGRRRRSEPLPVAVARARRAGAGRRGDPRVDLRSDPDSAVGDPASACGDLGSRRNQAGPGAGARWAIGGVGALQPPTSRWWMVFGTLQTLTTAAIVLSAAWVLVWILVRPVTGSIEVPLLGPIPSPFVALLVSLLAGYLVARLLGAHAGWLGSRWAGRVRGRVAKAVEQEVQERAFSRLDQLEEARARLSEAVADIERSCPAT